MARVVYLVDESVLERNVRIYDITDVWHELNVRTH